MKCKILVPILMMTICLALKATAQHRPLSSDNPPPPPGQIDPEEIFEYASEFPSFPGGDNAKQQYINENLRYPQECIEKGIKGIVFLKVVIDKKGNIVEVRVEKGPKDGKALEAEAIRLYKQMPRWNPGRMKSGPVNMRIKEVVRFEL